MSQDGRKTRMSKGRGRALPGVKSATGKAQIESAQQWVRCHLNLHAEIGDPRPDLRWTKTVPGYQEAHASAVEAATRIIAETGFVREIAVAPQSQYPTIVDRWKLKSGSGSPGEIIARLVQAAPPAHLPELLRELACDLYNAQRNGESQWPLIRAVARNPGLFSCGPSIGYDEVGELYFSGRRSPLRTTFPAVWISCAPWLAEVPDMAAVLETRLRANPELAAMSRPTEATLRRWISELGLFRYQGKGRIRFDWQGEAQKDDILTQELACAKISRKAQ